MQFETALLPGRLVKRYKRFLADITLETGEMITATCPNTGSMKGLTDPGSRVWVSVSKSATRKYPHTWEMIEADLGAGPVIVGINTNHPNRLVAEAITAGLVPGLARFDTLRREVKYGRSSRIDILLEKAGAPSTYVEVKNVHLSRSHGLAEFPDSVTERGAKHLAELADMVAEGHKALMVYLIQRADAERFTLAHDIDAAYAKAFEAATKRGVDAIALTCTVTPQGITVARTIPIAI